MLDMVRVVSVYYIIFRYNRPLLNIGSFKQKFFKEILNPGYFSVILYS